MIKYIFLLTLLSCGLNRSVNPEMSNKYPLVVGKHGATTIMMDVYNPISYNLYFDESGALHTIVFITHRYGRNRPPYVREFSLKGIETSDALPKLKKCEAYIDYTCSGLDGSYLWIKYGNSPIQKYWNPSLQEETVVGSFYLKLLSLVNAEVDIEVLKSEFIASLPSGRYWNFGEGVIKI